jgi:hypothetical protein
LHPRRSCNAKLQTGPPARRVNSPPRPPFRCLYLSAKDIHIHT